MKSVKEIFTHSLQVLEKNDVVDAKPSAEKIIAKVLGCKRLDIYLFFDQQLSKEEIERIFFFLEKRKRKEPLEYLFSEVEFYGTILEIQKDVLIPRVETEILVDLVCNKVKDGKKTLWDIGTGSGCIAISLKKWFPSFQVVASDISLKALQLAKKNAQKNQVNIFFKKGDLFQPFQGEKTDILVCNPPYVSEKEYLQLSKEVKYEPKIALLAKNEGLEFYQRIEKEMHRYLNKKACVFLEIGKDQKKEIQNIFSKKHYKIEILPDFSGHDRFFFLEME